MSSDLSFQCTECGKKFQSGAHLSNHLKKPHPPRSFIKRLRESQEVKQVSKKKDSEKPGTHEFRLSSVELGSSKGRNLDMRISNIPLEAIPTNGSWKGQEATPINRSIDFEINHQNADSWETSDFDHRTNDSNEIGDGFCNYGSDSSKGQMLIEPKSVGGSHSPDNPTLLSSFSIGHAPISVPPGHDLHRMSLPRDVFQFYKYFGDESEQMYGDLNERERKLDGLPDTCKLLVQYCMRCGMSQSEMGRLFQLQLALERCYDLPESTERSLSRHFQEAESFVSFVVYERKRLVATQGWKKAIIVNSLGIKQVGVFLPITRVINRVISEAGGIEQIRKFRMQFNRDGKRTFSCPLDSDIMRIEAHQTQNSISRPSSHRIVREPPKVFFSMYCDETLLSRSGSQDTAVVRIRVENIAGSNLVWQDVGIPPKLEVGSGSVSNAKRRQAKLELFHRFLFLMLEEIAAVNVKKLSTALGYEPVLLGFVTDQPQKRIFLCLKRGNCQQDCSFCCFRSAEDRVLRKRKRIGSQEAKLSQCSSPKKSKVRVTSQPALNVKAHFAKSRTDSGSNEEGSDRVVEHDSDSNISEEDDERLKDGCDVVTGIPAPQFVDRYVPRNVLRTVKMQLQAAVLAKLKMSDEYSFCSASDVHCTLPTIINCKYITFNIYLNLCLIYD